MADYTDLPDTAVGVGGIPSGTTVTALRDNPIAIAKRAVGAPKPIDDYELLTRTVISGTPATIDFTFDETLYDSVIFKLQNVIPQTDGRALWMRTSANDGAGYDDSAGSYRYEYAYQTGGTVTGVSSTSATEISMSRNLGSAGSEAGWSGTVEVIGPALSKRTGVTYKGGCFITTGDMDRIDGFASRMSDGVVNGVRFLLSDTGGFEDGGLITMYGVRNS